MRTLLLVAVLIPTALFVAGLFQPVSVDVEHDEATSTVLLDEGYRGVPGDGCECIYIPRWRLLTL